MKRQSSSSSSLNGGEKRNRHSSRTTVLSKAFRVVDAETRQEVRNKRIQQLEADNYGDADVDGQSALQGQDDEAYQDNSDDEETTQKKKKKKLKQQKALPLGAGGSTKRSTLKVRSLERIIMEQGYQYHLQQASTGKSSAKLQKKRTSSSAIAIATVITIKDEDEEGRDEDAMGNDENPCMDVDDDADYGSSSSSSSNRNKRGMKSTGSLSSIQCRGGSSSSAREEEEVEVVDSPFVYPNTLSIAGSHNLNTPS